jgi:hypothetical protein
MVQMTIALVDLDLDSEELDQAVGQLLQELRDLDAIEPVQRVAPPPPLKRCNCQEERSKPTVRRLRLRRSAPQLPPVLVQPLRLNAVT